MNKATGNFSETATPPTDLSIGDIIRQTNNLSAHQVESVLAYQREHGVKFGEAAVALGFAKPEDVLWALAQQFHYPYAAANGAEVLNKELVVASQPFSEEAEMFRSIRSRLIEPSGSNQGSHGRAIAVVSPNTGDGKSFFAANLAVVFSQLAGRTLLLDADMRTPRQHEIFDIESSAGLSGILSGRSETNVIRPVKDLPNLYVLPVGIAPPNPLELVQHAAFKLLLGELLAKFEYVIVDTPAASHGADARVIAERCGRAVIIGRKEITKMPAMKSLVNDLSKTSVHVAGVIMNEV